MIETKCSPLCCLVCAISIQMNGVLVNDTSALQDIVFAHVFDESIKMTKLGGSSMNEFLKAGPVSDRSSL